jgi:farnesyl diphosphate synthase
MSAIQARTETALERLLPASTAAPARLHEAMRYATLGGGKRVRPLLCHAAGAVFGAEPGRLDIPASAVELIHVYSLVHDDLPCMDDDVLRRGKPTCHVEFDEATALLVGDALQTLAFQVLAEHGGSTAMVALLSHAAGSRGMAGGQAIDLAAVGKLLTVEELEFMHIHKTGALIRAAVLLGAQVGGADEEALRRLGQFAGRAGLLFQVVDDILDAEANTATLGKTAGKDAAQNKPTYVSLVGVGRARLMAAELRAEAKAALTDFGDRAQRLLELTDYIVERTF